MCVAAVQEDKNGTLSYDEFTNLLATVAKWKKMYFKFDRDRSGTLEKGEVAAAITSLGEEGREVGVPVRRRACEGSLE